MKGASGGAGMFLLTAVHKRFGGALMLRDTACCGAPFAPVDRVSHTSRPAPMQVAQRVIGGQPWWISHLARAWG